MLRLPVAVTAAIAAISFTAACGGSSARNAPPAGPPPPGDGTGAGGATANAGGPPTLRLPRTVAPIEYRATVHADPSQATFSGSIEIDVVIDAPTTTIWLNGYQLEVDDAVARRGKERVVLAAAKHGDDFLGFTAPRALAGAWTLDIRYRGQQEASATTGLFRQNDNGDWYAFTQFEAVYARRVFPCFDEPDRKTPWTLALEVPAALTAVSNTIPTGEAPATDGWKKVSFGKTRPLPSYLVAFAIGPFEIADAGKSRHGVPIRIVTPRGKVAHAATAVDVVPKSLALLEDYFDYPYPYDKLDFVPIPLTVGFGCMENPGMVTCVARAMLFDPATASPFDRRSIAGLSAHELAHMWFGNLVTLAWWDDIWLNEGLATWIEDRVMFALDPRPDDVFGPVDNHEHALDADSLATARAVRQPITTPDDILNVFDGVTYGKAGAVMTMFERWVGPEAFQRGIRAYLKKHADGNATTADFVAAMSDAIGKDMSGVSTFLDQPGAPLLSIDVKCEDGKPPVLTVAQSRYLPPGSAKPTVASTPWQIPMCVAHDKDGQRGETCTVVSTATAEIPLEAKGCPRWVWPNADGAGHYRVAMSPALVTQATGYGWSRMTQIERIAMSEDIATMIKAGQLDITVGIALVPRLMRENNRAAIEKATGFAGARQLVPEARMAAYDRWLLTQFGAEARKLGWLRKPGEAMDIQRRRGALVGTAAEAGDKALRRDAVKLAKAWRTLPKESRGQVMAAAVRADDATFDRFLAESFTEGDRVQRDTLRWSLTATRDPERIAKVLALLVDEKVDIREVMYLPYGFWREPDRTQVETFVREHIDELQKRAPSEGVAGGSTTWVGYFTNACDPARRDEIAGYVNGTFGKVPGAGREIAQAIEGMDQCIAWKAQMRPQVEAWAATLK
ncbi:MAG TPA: M1 family aminopeptidase [Kofleriaceae bacterium]|nr:M1 family aminopeptidase [Kofleriaceae bacterium]